MTQHSLNPVQQTLLRAIQIEARNGGLYESLAAIFAGYEESVVAMFREMADEERQHGAQLGKRYQARFGAIPPVSGDPTDVIEAPDLDDAEALVFDSMTLEQALKCGLRAEEMARAFYNREAAGAADPDLQLLYRELGEFEETHVQVLQEKLADNKKKAASSNSR